MAEGPSFVTPRSRGLRRLGLSGDEVTVALNGDEIVLSDAGGGLVAVPLSRIDRMRAAFVESKYGTYLFARLRLSGEPGPVELRAGPSKHDYAVFVMALARALIARHPRAVIETGDGPFTPVFLIAVFGAMALGSLYGTIRLATTGDDWRIFLGPLIISAVLLAILAPWTILRYWPRRVSRAEDLKRAMMGWYPG
jgi:hypothetical protein